MKRHRPDYSLQNRKPAAPAFLFDLDDTLVDSVYQHVLAWREALEAAGIELAVWRIHRRIGMSGGLLVNALLRETGRRMTAGYSPGSVARRFLRLETSFCRARTFGHRDLGHNHPLRPQSEDATLC